MPFAPFSASGGQPKRPGPSPDLFANPYYQCATQLYVDGVNGSDTTGTGAIGAPWKTIAKAELSGGPGVCINVLPGTYTAGATITHGGNNAAANGYCVYRSTVLGGAIITDPGNHNNSAFDVQANYVIVDGFTLAASTQQVFGQAVQVFNGTNAFTFSQHHIWVMNCTISGYGQSGLQLNNGEFFYAIHNTIFNCAQGASEDSGAQGSGISFASEIAIASYTLTADDQSNPVTGNTGTLFRQFIMWNVVSNNRLNSSDTLGADTDGNGIILDTWSWHGTSGASPYLNGGLVAFNVVYNNGGGGIHVFLSEYATVANNTIYNNFLDTNNTGTARSGIDSFNSYGSIVINNISVALGGAGVLAHNTAIGPVGPLSGPFTTTLNGTISSSVTALTLTSDTSFPGGGTFPQPSSGYQLPGGNLIEIDSEVMLVTAGWGTTTLTVQRGYQGTTSATHSSGATVTWVADYFSNNITLGLLGAADVNGPFQGDVYLSSQNKEATNPLWVNVGTVSVGSESSPPTGANFAISDSSPAIGYGLTFGWLPPQSRDAGAYPRGLVS